MRLVVRFLPGSLLLCAAAIALALLWDGGDAHADPPRSGPEKTQGLKADLPNAEPPHALPAHPAVGARAPEAVPTLLAAAGPPTTPSIPPPAAMITAPPPPTAESATATPARSAPSASSSDEAITGASGLVTPTLPAIPDVDPAVTTALLALPEIPSSSVLGSVLPAPPAPRPHIPPPVSVVTTPAAVPDALAFAASPDLAFTSAPPDPAAHSTRVATDAGGALASFANRDAPARGPPAQLPVPPCPDGGAPHANGTDLAGVVPACADDATRRALLLTGAHSYSATSLFDPLLRPD
jgi:hypothetical protein